MDDRRTTGYAPGAVKLADAISQFRQAAIEKGDFAEPANRDHTLFAAMAEAWRALEEHGADGHAAFRGLLADQSAHVRSWVAAQLLGDGDTSGVTVLEAEAALGGIGGFAAEMVLKEWREGRLAPPFGRVPHSRV